MIGEGAQIRKKISSMPELMKKYRARQICKTSILQKFGKKYRAEPMRQGKNRALLKRRLPPSKIKWSVPKEGMGWDGMGWGGMGWDEMGCDGKGREGVRQVCN
jgi:hypothetical protein